MMQVARTTFLACMVLCAVLVLWIVWSERGTPPLPFIPQLAATAFVIGLAAFIVWITGMVIAIRDAVDKKD